MPDLGFPSQIGGLDLHAVIRCGSTGSVHAAVDPQTGKTVVVKLLHRPPAMVVQDVVFTHPNIVQIFHHGCEHGQHYVVMEYASGGSLRGRLRSLRNLDTHTAIFWIRQVLLALDHLHAHGMLHRDIKPDNLLFFPDDRLKVSDFGLMCPMRVPPLVSMGTPGFMSPEQIMGLSLDPRSDLFSLGVVFYRMVTGRFPFSGSSVSDRLNATLLSSPPWPSHLQSTISPMVSQVIMCAISKRPSQRFADAKEFLMAIDEVGNHGVVK
ncbi:MAG: serine/threonine protein kinase [Magnetococcales bacterium]|nr:serine/threonine protein kinase [Magnetococcales bacterium]